MLVPIGPYSALMQESTDHNNSEYGHFLRGEGQRGISEIYFERQ